MYTFDKEFLIKNKKLTFCFKKIFGINFNSIIFMKKLGFSFNIKSEKINNKQLFLINEEINFFKKLILDKLFMSQYLIFKKLLNLNVIKILKLKNGLPIRGQRTHTNAKTNKKLNFNKLQY